MLSHLLPPILHLTSTLLDIRQSIESNHAHTQEGTHTREHQSHNTPSRETTRQPRNLLILARKIGIILGITGGITRRSDTRRLTNLIMLLGDSNTRLNGQGGLNEHHSQTLRQVPINMAMEEPHTGVIGLEAHNEVTLGREHKGISPGRVLRERGVVRGIIGDRITVGVVIEMRSIRRVPIDHLEGMTVKMEWVGTGVAVVEDDLDDLVPLQHDGVRVVAVDSGVCGLVTRGHDGVQGGDFGSGVGDVVEEGVVGAVVEVLHGDSEVEGDVRVLEKGHSVMGDKGHVVVGVEI